MLFGITHRTKVSCSKIMKLGGRYYATAGGNVCTCVRLTGKHQLTVNRNGGIWRPVLVKIMTIKLHYKSVLTPLQQILWTCCIFLSSINNTFFSVLVIILSNMSYFCFNYKKTFFIYTMSYFSVVLRIMFSLGRELFFAVSRIYFWAYNALRGLQLKWTGSSL